MKNRGLGFVFQPTWRDKKTGETRTATTWWISYSVHGKRHKENAHSANRADAVRLLKQRHAEAAAGKPVGAQINKVVLAVLLEGLISDYKINSRRSLARLHCACKHLLNHFGADTPAINITEKEIGEFIVSSLEDGYANATINRSLAALRRALRLGKKLLSSIPEIHLLEENNARQGFLTHEEFLRLNHALPADLRDPVMFLYLSAWRVSEMRSLQWRDVRLNDGLIILRSENSKNKKPRTLPLRGELRAIVERAVQNRRLDCPFVFLRGDGAPVGSFRKAWASACRIAGLGNVLVHDLRRCGVRNLIRSGVDQKTAMMISGHKTISTFHRYQIVADEDLVRAIDRMSDHLAAQSQTSSPKVVSMNENRPSSTVQVESKFGAVR